ncbi:MAG TPA: YicC/YloC family endoribonuclease [Gammaproteobacteria bacterium]|nr:YicC/YloC family endoribonuclease [Gammaproteobacteria bacterium]
MIVSMTAFARTQTESGELVCEIRSINHRYLEMSAHLPDGLRAFEMPLREVVRSHVKRGKVDFSIRYQRAQQAEQTSFVLNTALAKNLCEASDRIKKYLPESAPVNPADILAMPGVLIMKEMDVEALKDQVLAVMTLAVKELMLARAREGNELKALFLQRADGMRQLLLKVQAQLPKVIADQQERLMKRFKEAAIELDPQRLEQEMLFFIQKIDITEEIERIQTHLDELARILKEGGLVGRRLDFLSQELNREANTLGSKSVDPEIIHAAVEMKVLIEQLKEQVQNVE